MRALMFIFKKQCYFLFATKKDKSFVMNTNKDKKFFFQEKKKSPTITKTGPFFERKSC